MATRMCLMVAAAFVFCTSMAQAGPVLFGEPQVIVELVPDNAGPYYGGERVTVDFWLHSRAEWDVYLKKVRFDFSDTSPQITLDPALNFDLSSVDDPTGYSHHPYPELPVPWLLNDYACICPSYFLFLPQDASLHIADVSMVLPTEPGSYFLDVLNADEPHDDLGAQIKTTDFFVPPFWWSAYDGEIAGGVYEFVIIPEPTSLWMVALCGLMICRRRPRLPLDGLSNGRSAQACTSDRRSILPAGLARALAVCCLSLGLPHSLRAKDGAHANLVFAVRARTLLDVQRIRDAAGRIERPDANVITARTESYLEAFDLTIQRNVIQQ